VVAFSAQWTAAGLILTVVTLAFVGFFRDPERQIPAAEGLIVSPADGKVVSIASVEPLSSMTNGGTRISIFLSPLDVHVNRAPVDGEVKEVHYQQGKFVAAYHSEAARINEQNALKIVDPEGRVFAVVQIAGVLARRIVCRVKPGDHFRRGDKFGIIMFGSRTDVYLPSSCRVEVLEGQRVKGGETIIGRME